MNRTTRTSLLAALALTPHLAFAQTGSSGSNGASNPNTTTPSSTTGAVETPPAAPSNTPSSSSSSTPAASSVPVPVGPAAVPAVTNLEERSTPIVELHGYLRTRWELFYNFALGWDHVPGMPPSELSPMTNFASNSGLPWYRSPDSFSPSCGPDTGTGVILPATFGACYTGLQHSANMRFRLNPEFHPTEYIAIHSQIDLLDNLVLGSTPEGYYATGRSPWAPLTAFSNTQVAPTFGFNSITNSIVVKRAWGEFTNQTLGQLRVGRMPSHWGLGILANAGNGFDSDYQSTADRIMYAARIRPLGLFIAAMWDFPSIGATSANLNRFEPGQGQPYDLGSADNVYQWVAAVGRRQDQDQIRSALSRNELVINGGGYFVYRMQNQSGEGSVTNARSPLEAPTIGTTGNDTTLYGRSLIPRNAQAFIADGWIQLLGRNFRIEAEAAYIRGGIYTVDTASTGNSGSGGSGEMTGAGGARPDRLTISQFGAALEVETRWLNNRLRVDFRAGYASGDPELGEMNYFTGLRQQRPGLGQDMLTLFRFHPDYRIDLVFWRQIMQQFAGAYYLRPSVQYNFLQDPNGDLFFGRLDIVWSRASEFLATRGNHADLGIEFDATIQYQSNYRRDPTDSRPAPGFYAQAQYGAFIPLAGVGPTDQERLTSSTLRSFASQTAHTARAVVGVQF